MWIEHNKDDKVHELYKVGHDSLIQSVFQNSRMRRSTRACNCKVKPGSVIAVDHSHDLKTEILFYDTTSEAIVAADLEGCNCRQVLEKETDDSKGMIESTEFNVHYGQLMKLRSCSIQ